MTTKQYQISVDWPSIHAAATAVDIARRGAPNGLRVGATDPFGGTYFGPWYERAGLVGLISIARAADALVDRAWEIMRTARETVALLAAERAEDARLGDWACVLPSGEIRRGRWGSHRGARWMATRHGGRVVRLADPMLGLARKRDYVDQLRSVVVFLVAVHDLRVLLRDVGVIAYDPNAQIGGVSERGLMVQGLRWLDGQPSDDGVVPLDEAYAILDRAAA